MNSSKFELNQAINADFSDVLKIFGYTFFSFSKTQL